MKFDYDNLLKSGQSQVPESIKRSERFEIPKIKGHFQGNRTMTTNFSEIAQTLRRDPEHMLKFLSKALAAQVEVTSNQVAFGRKIKSQLINEKIEQYAKTYVICRECGKPDTQLEKEDRLLFIRCQACGARHAIPEKI